MGAHTIRAARCVQCDTFQAMRHLEAVEIDGETFHVCETCAEGLAGPGKYEGIAEDDRALCVVLEWIAGVSGMDHWLSDDSYGYAGVVGRYLLLEDDRGFVDVRTFPDAAAAMREINGMEDDGFGASESDAWITDDRGGYSVLFDGRYVDTFLRLNRARAKVSLLMRETGYYPNVFHANERGNVRRIEVW